MFAKYSDNVFCSGDVLIAEKRQWGHRRYSRGRHCILRVSLIEVSGDCVIESLKDAIGSASMAQWLNLLTSGS